MDFNKKLEMDFLMFQADALEWATVLIPGDQDHFQVGRGGPVLVGTNLLFFHFLFLITKRGAFKVDVGV